MCQKFTVPAEPAVHPVLSWQIVYFAFISTKITPWQSTLSDAPMVTRHNKVSPAKWRCGAMCFALHSRKYVQGAQK